jgi:hypothetical protein
MKLSLALLAASCGLVAAHGDFPLPKIVGGRRFLSDLKGRHGPDLPRPRPAQHAHVEKKSKSQKRQSNTSGQCGPGYGSCAVGYCCSSEGYDYSQHNLPGTQLNRVIDGVERVQITARLRTARSTMDRRATGYVSRPNQTMGRPG